MKWFGPVGSVSDSFISSVSTIVQVDSLNLFGLSPKTQSGSTSNITICVDDKCKCVCTYFKVSMHSLALYRNKTKKHRS